MTDTASSAKPNRQRRPTGESESAAARWMTQITDLGLVLVIFVAPLFMGGRYEVGRTVYVACVSLAALGCIGRLCVRKQPRWRLTGAEPLLLGGLILLVLQLVPLPSGWIQAISPETSRLLPLWGFDAPSPITLGDWQQLSLTPRDTQGGLVTFLAHGLLFLTVVQRIRDRSDVDRLLRWLALAAIGMAVLGMAQFLFGNGKFLWIYEHPSRDTYGVVKGTFQNQNHFAHFLILGLGPLFWWLQRFWPAGLPKGSCFQGRSGESIQQLRFVLLVATGLVLIGILLTFSRGGVLSACVVCLATLCLMAQRRLLDRNALISIGGLTIVLGGALAIHGYEPLAKRLATLRDSQSLDEVCHGRKELWEAHLRAIPQFLIAGTGAGSHREIYQTYMTESFHVELTHGENGYLHLALEMGIVGLALGVAALLLAMSWCLRVSWRGNDKTDCSAAIAVLVGLLASAVHSLGDFVWYIPACLSLTVILAACGCRIYQLNRYKASLTSPDGQVWRPGHLRLAPHVALLAAVGSVSLIVLMLADRVPTAWAAPHWEAYYRLALAEQDTPPESQDAADEGTAVMVEHLRQALLRDPHNARAHLRLARLCLREFDRCQGHSENPMPLRQIRDAALASKFPSPEAMNDWLAIVLADNRIWLDRARWHTRQALRLCPLFGDGYVYLAELAFLDGADSDSKRALVQQALIVQPHSGNVLMAAGGEAALANDADEAMELWKKAFHQDIHQRRLVIEMLATEMPAQAFVEHFQPNVDGLAHLYAFYHQNKLASHALELADDYANALQAEAERLSGEAAARRWSQAAAVYEFAGNIDRFVSTARHAVLADPNDLAKRRVLIRALVRSEEYAEAVEHLQWCVSREPDDAGLQRQLENVYRRRLTNQQAKN